VLGRVGFAAVALNLVVLAIGQRMPRDGKIWAAFLAMGALNNLIPFALIVWGQSHIASGLASILNATTPLFTIVVAHFLTQDERITTKKIIGVVLGLLGVAVTIGSDALAGLSDNILAQFACLGATLSYAFAGIYGRRFKAMGVAPLATATGQVTATTAMMLPLVLLVDRPWTLPAVPGLATWGALFGVALLCTALAYILYFRLLAKVGATNLALVTFLIPLSAILLGAMVLGERLEARHFAGMALIGLGLATIDGRPFAAIRDRVRHLSNMRRTSS
jgi:drug/metabolite transporter (DMT)-like permease